MLEGLESVEARLTELGIPLAIRLGQPDEACLALARDAASIVCDRGYLRPHRAWVNSVRRSATCKVVQVEGDVVVPVEKVSDKREYAARTIRPRIQRIIEDYLEPPEPLPRLLHRADRSLAASDVDLGDIGALIKMLGVDDSVGRVSRFRGGEEAAQDRLADFLDASFDGYASARNDPSSPQCSNLSPYLHFGQISPVDIATRARSVSAPDNDDATSFLEELIVRRELAMNFVYYEPDYDRYDCLPEWAQLTLAEHAADPRDYLYDEDQLAAADTHDPYWNAAMTEMVRTGYMHNYMRMYWGKKIIEWSETPQAAYATTLALNNRYFIDGRDGNSYTGVGWVFGLHDRPWTERPIFGKVRYMNARGLERKFDIRAYASWAASLEA